MLSCVMTSNTHRLATSSFFHGRPRRVMSHICTLKCLRRFPLFMLNTSLATVKRTPGVGSTRMAGYIGRLRLILDASKQSDAEIERYIRWGGCLYRDLPVSGRSLPCQGSAYFAWTPPPTSNPMLSHPQCL